MIIYFFNIFFLKKEYFYPSLRDETTPTPTPYFEDFEDATPSHPFLDDFSSQYISDFSKPTSFIKVKLFHQKVLLFFNQERKERWFILEDDQNIDGKEKEEEEKYFIDHNGNKRQLTKFF